MNLLNFKQETKYWEKKKGVVAILFLFSLVCLFVSIQSGAVFIHSFISAYLPDISWFWPYTVAVAIDLVLFYLASQFFSDLFSGLDGQKRYLDLPTLSLSLAFLAFSLFISIKGADIRKSHHSTEINNDQAILAIVEEMAKPAEDKAQTIKGDERNKRKALEASAKKDEAKVEKNEQVLEGLSLLQQETTEKKKSFSELLDFSKTIVVVFQLLLILCSCCSEYMKSKKGLSKAEVDKSKSDESTSKSGQKQDKSESKSGSTIGFFGNGEGHILNSTIAYKKSNGEIVYYKPYQLSTLISDARKKLEKVDTNTEEGKKKAQKYSRQIERCSGLKEKLTNSIN